MDDFISRRSFTEKEIKNMNLKEYAKNRELIMAQSLLRLNVISYPVHFQKLLVDHYRGEDRLLFSVGKVEIYVSRYDSSKGDKQAKFVVAYHIEQNLKNARVIHPDKVRKVLSRCRPVF